MAKKDIMLIAQAINNGGHRGADQISAATKIPKWKVARVLKRLEKLGFVQSSMEIKFSIGRPRKLYSITDEGLKFFSDMGMKIFEPPKHEETAPNRDEK